MKKQTLTILLFLFFGSNCIGQKVDTINIGSPITGITIIDLDSNDKTTWFTQVDIKKQDTVRVLMLVCDTLGNKGFPLVYFIDTATYTIKQHLVNNYVWWQMGYEVRRIEKRNNYDGVLDPYSTYGFKPQEWNVYFHEEYLDQNKKQISRNIVVWITKEIK